MIYLQPHRLTTKEFNGRGNLHLRLLLKTQMGALRQIAQIKTYGTACVSEFLHSDSD